MSVRPTKKITLQAWAEARYDPVPTINTLRAWARDCRIFPLPQKVGRTYYVDPDARYVENNDPAMGNIQNGSAAA